MPKRFIDSEVWKKQWFRELSPTLKSFWIYICLNCDNCGVWEMDIPLAEFQIGAKICESDLLNDFNGNIIKISENKLFVVDFISFQYGELKEDSIPHRNVFRLLQKHNVGYPIDTLSIGYKGFPNTLKDKDKDKEEYKEKEEEKKKEREENFNNKVHSFTSYPEVMLNKFVLYWTEWNKSKTKMRFELEQTWDLARRLNTWASRDKDFVNNKKQFGRQEITVDDLFTQMEGIKLS